LQSSIRAALPKATQAEIERLRRAPVILNWDVQSHRQPLAYIRRGRRGIGDHALTLFRTDKSMVFDQSHIFFVGMWGRAIAEIVTNSAINGYQRCAPLVGSPPAVALRPPLALQMSEKALSLLAKAPRVAEVSAEADGVDVERIARLRRRLAERGWRLPSTTCYCSTGSSTRRSTRFPPHWNTHWKGYSGGRMRRSPKRRGPPLTRRSRASARPTPRC
jgi:hypothetical protein